MNFSTLKSFYIPEGKVSKIQVNGQTIWQEKKEEEEIVPKFNYVSFGDSIAAGHLINNAWYDAPYYGHLSQYGQKLPGSSEPNASTLIVENTYTDLVRKYLEKSYGEENVKATSFARSGSRLKMSDENFNPSMITTEQSMIELLSFDENGSAKYPKVIADVREADIITICIGANDVLEPALNYVVPYLKEGKDLSELEALVEENLIRLSGDGDNTSYMALLNKIKNLIKPTTKVVFTTVYNPFKYLYLEKGTWDKDYMDGFWGYWLDTIPDFSLFGKPEWLDIDKEIKKGILNTPALQALHERVNALGTWAERYLDIGGTSKYYPARDEEGKIIRDANGNIVLKEYAQGKEPVWKGLNHVIRNSIADFNDPNFMVTESHELFDTVPDRQGAGELHYNDLVNCQITRGYDANYLPWNKLWGNAEGTTTQEKIRNYWLDLVDRHFNLRDGLDLNGIATEIAPTIISEILYPSLDVHPRADGHYLMYRSFADTLGWQSLHTISYNANGGTGTMADQKVLDNSIVNGVSKKIYSIINPNTFIPMAHYHFNGWKADNGNRYSNKQAIYVTTDILLNAQWTIDTYTLTVVQGAKDEYSIARLFARDYSNRKLYIGDISRYLNSDKTTWNSWLSNTQTFTVAYGETIKMSVQGNVEKIISDGPKPNCSISQYNGSDYTERVVNKVAEATFDMPARNITIEYHFKSAANVLYSHSYWLGYIGDKDLNVTYSGKDS